MIKNFKNKYRFIDG